MDSLTVRMDPMNGTVPIVPTMISTVDLESVSGKKTFVTGSRTVQMVGMRDSVCG